ncbi:MAG: hypothetical protein LBH44_07545 [Treponema sp.]|nr:hypothetical protein [Treponema sp.]
MPPIINPTDQKLCPFFQTVCKKQACALFLEGDRACAITVTAIFTGNILYYTERRD